MTDVATPRRPWRPRIGTLQTRIVVFFGLMMVVVQGVGLVVVHTVGTKTGNRAIADALATGQRVFQEVVDERASRLSQAARILAADYAFRAALASRDQETITSALANHGARIDAQVMMLVGLDRVVIADSTSATSVGHPFALPGMMAVAERDQSASAIVLVDGRLRQIVVVPVLAPLPVGWVVMGFAVDGHMVRELERIAGLDVTFVSRDTAGAWSVQATTLRDAAQPALARDLHEPGWQSHDDMKLGGEHYATRVSSTEATDPQPVAALLQLARAEALAPYRHLVAELVAIAAIGILVSILCSIAIARGITQPVRQLALFARRIATGDYDEPPTVDRVDEIGDLATAFEHMRSGIVRRERTIGELAYRDSLTGLPNRALFNDRLRQALAASRRLHTSVSILTMDLDRFKDVNDTLGHPLGDLLLREVAARLTQTMRRETDTVARLGGDEFAMLLPTADLDAARRVVHNVTRAFEKPVLIEGHVVDVRASIGIATCPDHAEDLEGLVRRADVAMYLAKRGNTGHAVYDVAYDQRSADRLSLMGELRRAVDDDQLVLFYQPKVGLADPAHRSVEALIRWQHPTRGFVPPDEFIPFAEQTGYIRAITMWALDRAVAQNARWRREGLSIETAVNLSARDLLNADLPDRLASMIALHAIPADALRLEITESAILEDARHAFENLGRLAALGCRLSIDDYGTGYSSLSYLKNLPVDELKIDRSFVTGMLASGDDRVIVQSTIDLAHNMGLTVTAEGVEDDATLERLRAMGCDTAQGYLMSRPIPAQDVARWMAGSPWLAATSPTGLIRLVG